jgi:hypothetical protein
MKTNHTKLQDNSEIECVQRFLPTFNKLHKAHFKSPQKNPIQNEVDVFCHDTQTNECLKIQIKKADPDVVGSLGKSRQIPLEARPLITRDHTQTVNRISDNIKGVEKKYSRQGKDMLDIILLLDEMMDPPLLILQEVKSKITESNFKEIWLTTRTNAVYRIY